MREKWAEIEECPDYLVSNKGRVLNRRTDRLVSSSLNKRGYLRVNLKQDGRYITKDVHRLVALGFVDGYFDGAYVNHIDGHKTNNFYTNLEWVTKYESTSRIRATGLVPGTVVETYYDGSLVKGTTPRALRLHKEQEKERG